MLETCKETHRKKTYTGGLVNPLQYIEFFRAHLVIIKKALFLPTVGGIRFLLHIHTSPHCCWRTTQYYLRHHKGFGVRAKIVVVRRRLIDFLWILRCVKSPPTLARLGALHLGTRMCCAQSQNRNPINGK